MDLSIVTTLIKAYSISVGKNLTKMRHTPATEHYLDVPVVFKNCVMTHSQEGNYDHIILVGKENPIEGRGESWDECAAMILQAIKVRSAKLSELIAE